MNSASWWKGVAPPREVAEEVTLIGSRQIFYARLPEVKGTAGTAAFPIDGVPTRARGVRMDDEPCRSRG